MTTGSCTEKHILIPFSHKYVQPCTRLYKMLCYICVSTLTCLMQELYSILNHVLSSYRGEYGVTNVGKQELTLVEVVPHNERVFDHSKYFI